MACITCARSGGVRARVSVAGGAVMDRLSMGRARLYWLGRRVGRLAFACRGPPAHLLVPQRLDRVHPRRHHGGVQAEADADQAADDEAADDASTSAMLGRVVLVC